MDEAALWRGWRLAAGDAQIDAALRSLYAELDGRVRQGPGVCARSGRCCRFDEFGHRLYVTALEVAWVGLQAERQAAGAARPGDGAGACPFQVGKLCGVHEIRPMGCRVFFCTPGTDDWQHALYEEFLGRLRALHGRHRIEYRYLEWRAGLAAWRQWGAP